MHRQRDRDRDRDRETERERERERERESGGGGFHSEPPVPLKGFSSGIAGKVVRKPFHTSCSCWTCLGCSERPTWCGASRQAAAGPGLHGNAPCSCLCALDNKGHLNRGCWRSLEHQRICCPETRKARTSVRLSIDRSLAAAWPEGGAAPCPQHPSRYASLVPRAIHQHLMVYLLWGLQTGSCLACPARGV